MNIIKMVLSALIGGLFVFSVQSGEVIKNDSGDNNSFISFFHGLTISAYGTNAVKIEVISFYPYTVYAQKELGGKKMEIVKNRPFFVGAIDLSYFIIENINIFDSLFFTMEITNWSLQEE